MFGETSDMNSPLCSHPESFALSTENYDQEAVFVVACASGIFYVLFSSPGLFFCSPPIWFVNRIVIPLCPGENWHFQPVPYFNRPWETHRVTVSNPVVQQSGAHT